MLEKLRPLFHPCFQKKNHLKEFSRELYLKIFSYLTNQQLATSTITLNRYCHQLTLDAVKVPIYRLIALANLLLPYTKPDDYLHKVASSIIKPYDPKDLKERLPSTQSSWGRFTLKASKIPLSYLNKALHSVFAQGDQKNSLNGLGQSEVFNILTSKQAYAYQRELEARIASSFRELKLEDSATLKEKINKQLFLGWKEESHSEQRVEQEELKNFTLSIFNLANILYRIDHYLLIQIRDEKKIERTEIIKYLINESHFQILKEVLKIHNSFFNFQILKQVVIDLINTGKVDRVLLLINCSTTTEIYHSHLVKLIFEKLLVDISLKRVIKLAHSLDRDGKIIVATLLLENDHRDEALALARSLKPFSKFLHSIFYF